MMAEYASLYIDLEIIALTIDYETNNRLLLEIYIDYKFELIVRLLFKIPQRSLKKKRSNYPLELFGTNDQIRT